MKTQWPYATLNHEHDRRDAGSLDEQRRMRTRYQPAERNETLPAPGETTITLSLKLVRASCCAAEGCVRKFTSARPAACGIPRRGPCARLRLHLK